MQFQPFARIPAPQCGIGTVHEHCFAVDGRFADVKRDGYIADIGGAVDGGRGVGTRGGGAGAAGWWTANLGRTPWIGNHRQAASGRREERCVRCHMSECFHLPWKCSRRTPRQSNCRPWRTVIARVLFRKAAVRGCEFLNDAHVLVGVISQGRRDVGVDARGWRVDADRYQRIKVPEERERYGVDDKTTRLIDLIHGIVKLFCCCERTEVPSTRQGKA